MTRSAALSRRTLLRGAGTALGLPWLEAMAAPVPGRSYPVRMAALYMPNGVNVKHWTPVGQGKDFQLSSSLEPLARHKSSVTVVSNAWNEAARDGDGHYVKESAILTCRTIRKTLGADMYNGVSMDQVAAQQAGQRTPLPSLELGISPVATGVDGVVGYTRLYGGHIAWSGPTTPLAREINPKSVYERLFRASRGTGNSAKMDTLLLDRVLDDANQLRTQVGSADKARLDEYLSVVRSLEQRLQRAAAGGGAAWKPLAPVPENAAPAESPKDYAEHVRLMLDLTALAFQTDTTRIVTFMFGNAVSMINFRFLEGVSGAHHDISHHGKDPDKLREYALINRWHTEQLAYLLDRLASMKEGEGTVLDNSMVLMASALSDGDSHDMHKLPVILGGKGGGRIQAGQHVVCSENTPLANLYVSMLQAFGTPVERFADSTGPMQGVLA
ncbi:MAG TPA: DUF1552 domain-containing protein [Bryobacteraceae bacterium]|nr:DUF1552 domain-containing protein [Bryobacteraceae bacterium]